MSVDESKRVRGLGWPCAHCMATGTEPFTGLGFGQRRVKCTKGCEDGFLRVRIPKGTLIKTIYHGERLAGRTYTVKVEHLLNGVSQHVNYHQDVVPTENPKVRWPGPGSYWSEADINDVELV